MSALGAACFVAIVVFVLAMLGILTRPLGFLAALWPANAVLLGLFVSRPCLAGYPAWIAAILAFLAAGMLTGDALVPNLWLTAANMAGVTTGYLLFQRLDADDRALRRPLSVLHMLRICVCASLAAALVGGGLALILFDRTLGRGISFWFTTELSNYIITLPVMLTAPAVLGWKRWAGWLRHVEPSASTILPAVALFVSLVGAMIVGGPGAIAFPVPALLWCSLSYRLFPMSIIVLLSSLAMLIAEAAGLFFLSAADDVFDGTMSFRLGITLLMVGPLTVTTIAVAQKSLLARLDQAVSTDGLTNILARRAYMERSETLFANRPPNLFSGIAVMMIDIDHFKRINDRNGHAAGDMVLVAVTEAIGAELRRNDLFGRLGGEEFAVTLADIISDDAVAMAERLRHVVERLEIPIDTGETLRTTISIGIVHRTRHPEGGLGSMLPLADVALYRAKDQGRNRIALYDELAAVAAAE